MQLWLREDEPALGWREPGATVSAYESPFNTWASMPQLIDAERWPAADRPGTIAYFCGALQAPGRPTRPRRVRGRHRAHVRANAVDLVERRLAHLLPGTSADGSFRWDLLCGRDGHAGRERDRHPALPRQRRPLRPLRAVLTGKRCATACAPTRAATTTSSSPATGPTTASTPGCIEAADAVRPAGGQRRPRALALLPDRGRLAQLR